MTEIAVLGVAFAVMVLGVVVCVTFRPDTADAVAKALCALATVFAAACPWKR